MSHESLWVATAPAPHRPRLEQDTTTDVAIVGGGMLGITAAYILAQQGLRVLVLESRRILEGVTGHTTGKVTSQHGLIYDRLSRDLGHDKAKMHAHANEEAKEWIARTVGAESIDCAWTRAPAYVYATNEREVAQVEAEAEAVRRLGIPAQVVETTELPFAATAVRFDDQAHFHPRRFLLRLAALAEEHGARIYEQTPVTSLDDGKPCTVQTAHATVKAHHVIVATNVPINDRAYFVTRMSPKRAYGLACKAPDPQIKGMYVSAGSPLRSLRPYEGDEPMLVAVGDHHKVGHETDTRKHMEALKGFVHKHFGPLEVRHDWSTQDYYPVDGYPYIGKYTLTARNTWMGTGFQGWGMTQTVAAAIMLSKQAAGEDVPWLDLYDPFDPKRVVKDLVTPKFVKTQAHIAKSFIMDRVRQHDLGHLDPGDGEVATIDGHKLAVHRDAAGKLHARPAQCTHMGCLVSWNRGEQSWDCPCHGSRFGGDGDVLHGPATKPLLAEDVEQTLDPRD